MLLSLHAQATLGFVKDAAVGTCYLKHYDDSCQMYEVRGSGLRAICPSDFEPEDSESTSEATLEVDIEVLQDRLAKKKAEQALRAAPTTPTLSSAQEKENIQPSWPPRKPEASASDSGKGGQRTDSRRDKQTPPDPKPNKPQPQPPPGLERQHLVLNPSRRS